jgi:hypothetical chaperone protein
MDNYRDAEDKQKLDRLITLIRQRAGHWLAIQVEAAKIALSAQHQTQVDLDRIAPGEALPVTRDDFDGAIAKLVGKTRNTVETLLSQAGVRGEAIDTILFTGGSSSVPLLRSTLSALIPGARTVEGDLFGGIGSGLALDARRKFG